MDKLVEIVLAGTLSKETIYSKEQQLIQDKKLVNEALQNDSLQLNSLPDANSMKQEADIIRRQLLEQYGGKERLEEMTFDEKRALLH